MVVLRCFAATIMLAIGPAFASDILVIDGDTIELGGTRYGIHGIDAPEPGQQCERTGGKSWNCGAAAVVALEEIVFPATDVHCDAGELDDYGRTIAVCWADGMDIGKHLVRSGLAWAFVKFATDYVEDEAMARAARIGIWQVESETPWDFRARRWSVSGNEAPDPNCPIKGNINSEGEHIYHPPWSPVYARTRISPEKGERWFCDEGEAAAAGWRPAYWGRRG
ncbi:thermonuclease family protein [Devosia sp. A16]|uniref:thermonuclease family protein n=1 Tax=Devosia sp. A16 TaxID=1736675 RepID=UPI0006D86283|nr:thermonuclease family protein [Devosia sp. A16]